MYRTPKACYKVAPVRRETEEERLSRDEMYIGSIWYHIMAKRDKLPGYGKAKFVKEPTRG